MESVYSAVRTESLYKQIRFVFKGLNRNRRSVPRESACYQRITAKTLAAFSGDCGQRTSTWGTYNTSSYGEWKVTAYRREENVSRGTAVINKACMGLAGNGGGGEAED
jgi:hypothetical protein